MAQMKTVAEMARKWRVSERTARNYCKSGGIDGAVLTGKTWFIPADARKPVRKKASKSLLDVLKAEKAAKIHGGIYHKIQVEFAYNSNRIEGSRLSHETTRLIFETNTVGAERPLRVDDIVEAANHFRCVDLAIDSARRKLTETFIKELHRVLKSGTTDSRKDWFAVGDWKKLPNEVGGRRTCAPENVAAEMKRLLAEYNALKSPQFDDILDFHVRFERIHPFQDGNGRVGRLILFKELLKNKITPFVVADEMKFFYYRGIAEWDSQRGFLRDTCLAAQDEFKSWLGYFRIAGLP